MQRHGLEPGRAERIGWSLYIRRCDQQRTSDRTLVFCGPVGDGAATETMCCEHDCVSMPLDGIIQDGDPVTANWRDPLGLFNTQTILQFALEVRLPVIGTGVMQTRNDKDGCGHCSE